MKNETNRDKNFWRRGQLLIEMLVALSILTVGFLGVTSLLSSALSLNRVVANNYIATYLGSEGIEITKNILDSNSLKGLGWGAGFSSNKFIADMGSPSLEPYEDKYLTFDPATNRYGYGFSVPTPFKRTIAVSLGGVIGGQNEIVVNSKVEWVTRGSGNFSVNVEDHFFNWR